jgi:hypothetical protein
MKMRAYLLPFGVLVLAIASWTAANSAGESASAEGEKPGWSPQQPLSVSLLQLIATPDAFDGKHVRVIGFVCIEHEGTGVYLHREDSEYGLTRNGLWLTVAETAAKGSREAEVKDRYALIEGRFTAKDKGHRGMWSGAIEDISRMQAWESRKAKK